MNTKEEVQDWATIEQQKIDAQREAYCAGLEALAAFLRTHPEVKLPEQKDFIEYTWNKDYVIDVVHKLGKCDKEYSEYYATISKSFGPIKYGVRIGREQVCERRVVGTKKVAAREAYMVPAEPEHEEEVVAWDCMPILKATEDAAE